MSDEPIKGSQPNTEAWVTRDYGSPGKGCKMSRAVLGEFLYYLLRFNGEIRSTYAMRPDLDRTYVQFGIELPAGKREEFELVSGFVLEKPPILVPPTSFKL